METACVLEDLGQKSLLLRAGHLTRELWLLAMNTLRVGRAVRRIRGSRRAGPAVIVLPGMLAGDSDMRSMRLGLGAKGYRAYRWCLGRNMGANAELLERFDARVRRIQERNDGPVILVGWSLGGLIAREYAKRMPGRVAAVVTLGSPFSGNIGQTMVSRLYHWVAGHPVSALPMHRTLSEKPPVPTAAIWSRSDGVIPVAAARGDGPEADVRIEVSCAHLAYPSDAAALRAVIDAIDQCGALAEAPHTPILAAQAA